ncbi:MAG: TatD family hydrolase, partial [Erysipelotrichaceae bacterium]
MLVSNMWIDTHAHLAEPEYTAEIDQVIQNALDHHIQRVLLIGCGITKAKEVIALAHRYPNFFRCIIGFHPEDILDINEADWLEMAELIQEPFVLAVGEIGLDYYWDKDPMHHE